MSNIPDFNFKQYEQQNEIQTNPDTQLWETTEPLTKSNSTETLTTAITCIVALGIGILAYPLVADFFPKNDSNVQATQVDSNVLVSEKIIEYAKSTQAYSQIIKRECQAMNDDEQRQMCFSHYAIQYYNQMSSKLFKELADNGYVISEDGKQVYKVTPHGQTSTVLPAPQREVLMLPSVGD